MKNKEQIEVMIEEAHQHMEKTRDILGKEVFQKRFKPVFEGFLTALCRVLDYDTEETTKVIKKRTDLDA